MIHCVQLNKARILIPSVRLKQQKQQFSDVIRIYRILYTAAKATLIPVDTRGGSCDIANLKIPILLSRDALARLWSTENTITFHYQFTILGNLSQYDTFTMLKLRSARHPQSSYVFSRLHACQIL